MIYSKESVTETLELIRNKTSGVIRIPAPDYAMGERWNDEARIEHGYTKLEDGTWVTEIIVEEYLGKLERDIIELYDNYQDSLRKNELLRQKNREMEYALRVGEKALRNALAMTKEMIHE